MAPTTQSDKAIPRWVKSAGWVLVIAGVVVVIATILWPKSNGDGKRAGVVSSVRLSLTQGEGEKRTVFHISREQRVVLSLECRQVACEYQWWDNNKWDNLIKVTPLNDRRRSVVVGQGDYVLPRHDYDRVNLMFEIHPESKAKAVDIAVRLYPRGMPPEIKPSPPEKATPPPAPDRTLQEAST